jgi:hypothetical protein
MLSFDLANQLYVGVSIAPAAYDTANAATIDGTGIDIGELSGTVLVRIDAALASSGETMTFTVEHSYDNTTFAAVAAAALVDPATGIADTITVNTAAVAVAETIALKRDLLRRYVRVVGTAAGNGTPAYACSALVMGIKKYAV